MAANCGRCTEPLSRRRQCAGALVVCRPSPRSRQVRDGLKFDVKGTKTEGGRQSPKHGSKSVHSASSANLWALI